METHVGPQLHGRQRMLDRKLGALGQYFQIAEDLAAWIEVTDCCGKFQQHAHHLGHERQLIVGIVVFGQVRRCAFAIENVAAANANKRLVQFCRGSPRFPVP